MTRPFYVTREEVKAELDVRETARSNTRIDRAIEAACETVEGALHRVFYPTVATRYFDWPGPQYARPWRLWLDANELISVTTLASGGVTIAASDYFLEPNAYGPPYNRIEVDLDSSAAFGGGDTHQRDITVTGLFGYRNDETPAETTLEALDASETEVQLHDPVSVGVGSLIRIDNERMIVTGRDSLATSQTITENLTATSSNTTFGLSGTPHFHEGETILIDGERMLITDLVGSTLSVVRAWDGSTLAAHTSGATVYRYNSYTVQRGALGTTAATHDNSASVYRWDPPAAVRQLCLAEAVNDLLQGRAGYARTAGAGENEREMTGRGLEALRKRVYVSHGRKARTRAV